MLLKEIVERIGGTLAPEKGPHLTTEITALVPLDRAKPGTISFLTNSKWLEQAKQAEASAIICSEVHKEIHVPMVIHPNPYWAMAKTAQLFYSRSHHYEGQSELAFIHSTASIHPTVTVYPFAYIGAHTTVGRDSVVMPHTFIGDHSTIGENVQIGPGSSIMEGSRIRNHVIIHGGSTIGADGFGFARGRNDLAKIPQVGRVEIEDHVEVGAGSTIDRATFGATHVRTGVKLDSQVHIGHNADIGEWTMLCGQVGIAGSAKIGKQCVAAGLAGVGNSIEIGDRVTLGPQTGAITDVLQPGTYYGSPPMPAKKWKRRIVVEKQLPEMMQRLKKLEEQLHQLQSQDTAPIRQAAHSTDTSPHNEDYLG
ncbi:MAG: UDP-3-O-(3-hydroxymyristoyl)glucosamine N-acyltransferase [Zetaproteobacteria bacterium]|nr:UDP-3-O-(3-hydroxymyristoyl)glucosamine N-acyltransferase [Zetaproteobacteria bacterium]